MAHYGKVCLIFFTFIYATEGFLSLSDFQEVMRNIQSRIDGLHATLRLFEAILDLIPPETDNNIDDVPSSGKSDEKKKALEDDQPSDVTAHKLTALKQPPSIPVPEKKDGLPDVPGDGQDAAVSENGQVEKTSNDSEDKHPGESSYSSATESSGESQKGHDGEVPLAKKQSLNELKEKHDEENSDVSVTEKASLSKKESLDGPKEQHSGENSDASATDKASFAEKQSLFEPKEQHGGESSEVSATEQVVIVADKKDENTVLPNAKQSVDDLEAKHDGEDFNFEGKQDKGNSDQSEDLPDENSKDNPEKEKEDDKTTELSGKEISPKPSDASRKKRSLKPKPKPLLLRAYRESPSNVTKGDTGVDTHSDDYLSGVIKGIEMSRSNPELLESLKKPQQDDPEENLRPLRPGLRRRFFPGNRPHRRRPQLESPESVDGLMNRQVDDPEGLGPLRSGPRRRFFQGNNPQRRRPQLGSSESVEGMINRQQDGPEDSLTPISPGLRRGTGQGRRPPLGRRQPQGRRGFMRPRKRQMLNMNFG